MKLFFIALTFLSAVTQMSGSAAMANTITQPHCNTGSACRTHLEENAVTLGNSPVGIGSNWGTGGIIQVGRGGGETGVGCGNCNSDIQMPVIVDNNCALSEPITLVGHPIEITEEYNLSPRVFSDERMAGTMDYWPWRFNVFVDADGMITQAFCG